MHSHLMGCPSCSLYREQIGFLTHIFEAYRKRQQVQSRSPLTHKKRRTFQTKE